MSKLILIRHGQSIWNAENRFTGWVDVDLSEQGILEAKNSGKLYFSEKCVKFCSWNLRVSIHLLIIFDYSIILYYSISIFFYQRILIIFVADIITGNWQLLSMSHQINNCMYLLRLRVFQSMIFYWQCIPRTQGTVQKATRRPRIPILPGKQFGQGRGRVQQWS